MTNQEFFEIVACFDRSTAQTMKLSTQEFTIEPVSYTHLDVYKRQVVDIGAAA